MENYKQDIQNTRKGCLGSSDGKLLSQVASLGYVPQSAKKRLAVVKGLIENVEIPKTRAIQYGDFIEQSIFEHLHAADPRFESNPLWVSEKYSRKNVKLITHPDIVLVDEEKKVLNVYEVKATKYSVKQTRETYKMQLCVHQLIAKELAASKASHWKVRLFLVHYDTNGLDLEQEFTFDPSRITTQAIKLGSSTLNVEKAMNTIDAYLETLDYYSEDDVVEVEYLPQNAREQFVTISNILREIKKREQEVELFKERLYTFLTEREISKVMCDDFSFTIVKPSVASSVDYKKIFEDEIAAKKPCKARRLKEKYKKNTQRKGYVQIKLRKENDNNTI